MKRIIAAALAAVLLCPVACAEPASPPAISAECAILMDAESGRVLFEKNSRVQRPIASITKLVTALVAAEQVGSLQEPVTVKPEWTGIEGSSIYLRAGEVVTVETLLYGLLLHSGNDAAVALAGYCAGDTDAFVERMNERARELGMEQTRFADPNGLSDEGHYSTAYDMALAARACLQNETVAGIAATKSACFGARTFSNHNKLLWRYDGCIGFKTGYTKAAGRTLVSGARRNGQTLIAVTLNAPDDWADHTALLDYGFASFSAATLCAAGETVCRAAVSGGLVPTVELVTAQELRYPLADGERAEPRLTVDALASAPVEQGSVLGTLTFELDGEPIGQTALVAAAAVHRDAAEKQPLFSRLRDKIETWFRR